MSSKNSQELKQKQTQHSNMSGTGNWQRVQRRPQQGQRNTFHRNRNGVEEQDGNRRPYRPRNQQRRRPQPKREVMAPNSIAAWGLSKDKSFKVKVQRASRSGEMVSRQTSNQFSAVNQDEKRHEVIEAGSDTTLTRPTTAYAEKSGDVGA